MTQNDVTQDTDLRATIEALAARVQEVEDKLEITQVVAQYGPNFDSISAEAVAELWTTDGIFEAVPHLRLEGREAITDLVNKAGPGMMSRGSGHVLTTPHVVIDGDRAVARNHAVDLELDPETGTHRVARMSAATWLLVRTSEGWQIAKRVTANLDGTLEHAQMLALRTPHDS